MEPQKLSGPPSRPMVGLGRRELCPSCEHVHVHPFPPGRSPSPGKGPGGQGSLGDRFCGNDMEPVASPEEWEAGCVSGELLHASALMLIPPEHQIHPRVAGAKEVGALAKVLRGTLIPIVASSGRIRGGSLLGNRLSGGGFLPDRWHFKVPGVDGKATRLLPAALPPVSGAGVALPPQLVGREEPWEGLDLLDAHRLPAKLSHWQAWKRGVLIPTTRTAFKLLPGLGPLEQVSCSRISFPVALWAGKLF